MLPTLLGERLPHKSLMTNVIPSFPEPKLWHRHPKSTHCPTPASGIDALGLRLPCSEALALGLLGWCEGALGVVLPESRLWYRCSRGAIALLLGSDIDALDLQMPDGRLWFRGLNASTGVQSGIVGAAWG